MSESYAIVKIELVFPYKLSLDTLIQFSNEWGFRLLSFGTRRPDALIAIPKKEFKKIWGSEVAEGDWHVPEGADDFMREVKVLGIKKSKH